MDSQSELLTRSLHCQAESICGPHKEQETLVEKVNAAAKEVREQVSESMQSEFTAAKGNEERTKQLRQQMSQRVQATFRSRAADIFSPAQRAAFEKAAKAQAAAEKAAKNKPKKGK